MTDKKQILKELEQEFEKAKKEIGFVSTFEELNKVFFIEDSVLDLGFVSNDFARQMCSKISEVFGNWTGYMNNLLLPNPGYMPGQTESKLFSSKEDREEIWDLIRGAMKFLSKNSLDVLKKDKNLQKEFIDGSLEFWNNDFYAKAEKIMQKIHDSWNE